jgi:hypothetical protein
MPTITNNYHRCEMLNLGSAPGGRGPFAIRQEGSPPGSMTMKQDLFLLRHDGVWVLNLAVFSLSEAEQQRFLYATAVDVMKALENLRGDPVVEDKMPEGVSKSDLLAGAESTASRLLSGLKNARPVQLP